MDNVPELRKDCNLNKSSGVPSNVGVEISNDDGEALSAAVTIMEDSTEPVDYEKSKLRSVTDASEPETQYIHTDKDKTDDIVQIGHPENNEEKCEEEQWQGSGSTNRFFGELTWDIKNKSSSNDQSNNASTSAPRQVEITVNKQSQADRPTFDIANLLEKNSKDLVTFLVGNLTNFTDFLETPLSSNTTAQLVFLVEKVCMEKSNMEISNVIVSRIYQNFMKQLNIYLVKLSLDDEEEKVDTEAYWSNPDAFWTALIVVFENIVDRLQTFAKELLAKMIKASLIAIEFHKNSHEICIEEDIKTKLECLSERVKNLRILSQRDYDQSDDYYQTANVYPDPNEVIIRTKPYIRHNIVDGAYRSVEHYLDTHFRLLREDFLAPLREAICTYKDNLKTKQYTKITELHVYTNVRFIDNQCNLADYGGICDYNRGDLIRLLHGRNKKTRYNTSRCIYDLGKRIRREMYKLVQLDLNTNTRHINSDESLMNGNLLIFSADGFETVFFGIVLKLKDTERGHVDVHLLQDVPFLYNKHYTMLECANYFGTYCYVLKALQNFDTDGFPMEEYIINVQKENEQPDYLTATTTYTIEDTEFTVLNNETWPSKEALKLNEMQYKAFKLALTSKLALIQGPPGTGKTHLGLKIVQTLIENYSAWNKQNHIEFYDSDYEDTKYYNFEDAEYDLYGDDEDIYGIRNITRTASSFLPPILIVAYTNHALDQFLEGLLPYTKNIVRLGQQCKNEAIREYVHSNSRLGAPSLADYYKSLRKALISRKSLVSKLESAMSYSGIFNIKEFAMAIPELQNCQIYNLRDMEIVGWLMGNYSTEEERNERWKITEEIIDDKPNTNAEILIRNTTKRYILTFSALEEVCQNLQDQLTFKDTVETETDWSKIENFYKQSQDNLIYLQWRIQNAKVHTRLYKEKKINIDDINNISYNDRWILYFHWLDSYIQHLQDALKENNSVLSNLWEQMEEQRQKEDTNEISRAVVVGMTTSGAARYQNLLKNLKCPIVVVEEAAEVLESHLVISLTKHCQHLILIGDHQQLRPSTSDYRIEKHYQLGISLFERMVRNGVPYNTLEVQHRMRPEISRLIVPAIYPNLKNHASVSNFFSVGGITHNVFFITHEHPEVENGISRRNPYEAKYVIALAKYLILQGYTPDEITILTTYKGQMHEIDDQRKYNNYLPLKSVRVTVVDNFQGEENEIILLSLVRSNSKNSIGFLAIENRVCVALTRAREGFYMIGNLNVLAQNSKIWPKVKDVLIKNKQVGNGLQLICQLHVENITLAIKPEDFEKVPDGGCSLPCDEELACGHTCQRKCHVIDQDHTAYRCRKPCTKIVCELNHACTKQCWQECGDCQLPVERTLPCEHQQLVPCSTKMEEYKCPTLVETLLRCGHFVQKPCFEDANKFPCLVEVETIKPYCYHSVKKKCHRSIYEVHCKAIVTIKLNCGHSIESHCWLKNAAYFKCREKCMQILACGHNCPQDCHYPLDLSHTQEYACKEKCTQLRNGCKNNHKCGLLCSQPCMLVSAGPSSIAQDETEDQTNTNEFYDTDKLYEKVISILNLITLPTFDKYVNQIRSLNIDTAEKLQGVVDIIYGKAIDAPSISIVFVVLCKELAPMKVSVKPEKGTAEFINFRKLLETKCQLEFEKRIVDKTERSNKLKEIEACTDPEKKEHLQVLLDNYESALRLKSVGNIIFTGELFKQQMLTVAVMRRYLHNLFKAKDNISLECVCALLIVVAKELERRRVNLSTIFDDLNNIICLEDGNISARVRHMIQDVITLRHCYKAAETQKPYKK